MYIYLNKLRDVEITEKNNKKHRFFFQQSCLQQQLVVTGRLGPRTPLISNPRAATSVATNSFNLIDSGSRAVVVDGRSFLSVKYYLILNCR